MCRRERLATRWPGARRRGRARPGPILFGGRRFAPALGGVLAALLILPSLPPAAARAQEAPAGEPPAPTVRVTASGSVELEPDRVVLAVGVESFADSAGAAAAANAERTAAVLSALRSEGVPDDRLETAGYRLEPEYGWEGPEGRGPREIARYRAWNMVRVALDSVARAGRLIDVAVAAGANRVVGVSFELGDDEEARRRALSAAVERARERAEVLAAAAGARLGPLLRLVTGGEVVPLPAPEMAMMRATSTPIEPGAVTVSETVTATWRLEARSGG